jgi:hypothetical protein
MVNKEVEIPRWQQAYGADWRASSSFSQKGREKRKPAGP